MLSRMPISILIVLGIAALAAPPIASAQTTWHVDDDAPNDPAPGDPTVSDPNEDGSPEHPFDAIQEGIDASADGDEVLVADGTYSGEGNRDMDFNGKAITVRSASGDPASCVIDCQSTGRGFRFHNAEGPDALVEGLTITNGRGYYDGGGVYCYNSSPTFSNCAISANLAANGGAVYCTYNGNLTLSNCTISANRAAYGGGVCCSGSDPTLVNCSISANSATGQGGAISCSASTPTLANCTISGNAAAEYGGGVYCSISSATLTNCILWGDTPQELHISSGAAVVTHCDVQGGWTGEGNIDDDPLFAFPDEFHLMPGSSCIDAGTNDPPGELPADDLDGNARPLDGDADTVAIADMGAYEFNPAAPSIAMSPSTRKFAAQEGEDDPPNHTLSIRNCGAGTLNWEITGQPDWLTVTPSSGESSGEVNKVTLSADTSDLAQGVYAGALEIADQQAVNSPREVVVRLYIGRTLDVPSEYPTIQAAIDAAAIGDVVEIADGTYTGPGNKDLEFGGKAITVCSASRDPTLCIIDCESDGCGFYLEDGEGPDTIVEGLTITNGSVSFHGGGICCCYGSPTITNCIISGNSAGSCGGGVCCYFSNPTITSCAITDNAAASEYYGGAGVYCYSSSPTLANCTISGNSADSCGGGVFCRWYSSPTLINCTISGNWVDYGGGINCYLHSSPTLTECTISDNSASTSGGICCDESSPTLMNCTISGNQADYGGGFYCYSGSPTLTNCTISGNLAHYIGGGGVCEYYSSPILANCAISGNVAASGGGIYCSESSPTLSNCTTSENAASEYGGAVYCNFYSIVTLTNCILWGDAPQEIYIDSGSPVVTYCDVQGGWAGEGNTDADPLFVDPDGPDDDPNTWEDNDHRLSPGSPCIDAADNTAVPLDTLDLDADGDTDEPTPFDLDARLRFADRIAAPDTGNPDPNFPDLPIVDMGAYEYQCTGDLDGNGQINLADLARLLGSYGETADMTYHDGDLDADGDVDLADLAELLGSYGTVCE